MENKFSYNYSANRNEELRQIREKYEIKTDEEQNRLNQIRALDRRIETPGKIIGILYGLASLLCFGSGLALCIETQGISFYIGIALGIIGIIGMATAPKISSVVFERQKSKHGAEILQLIDKEMGIKK